MLVLLHLSQLLPLGNRSKPLHHLWNLLLVQEAYWSAAHFSAWRHNQQCSSAPQILPVESYLTLCMLGNFSCFCCRLQTFFKINFFINFFQEHYQSVNGLYPDEDQHSFSPDLGPNCLQRLSAEDKVTTSKERVKSSKL